MGLRREAQKKESRAAAGQSLRLKITLVQNSKFPTVLDSSELKMGLHFFPRLRIFTVKSLFDRQAQSVPSEGSYPHSLSE